MLSVNNNGDNIYAYWSLGDKASSVTGLGGEAKTRYFTRPTGYPNAVYSLATQEENNAPNGLSQWNPLLVGIDLSQGMTTDPALIAQGNQSAWNWGFQRGMADRLAGVVSNLASIQSQLETVLKNDKLTAPQKQKLQSALDKIKAVKEKAEKMVKSGNLKQEEVEAVQGEIAEAISNASKTAEAVMKNVTEGKGGVDEADDTDAADETTSTEEDTKAQEAKKAAKAKADKKNKDEAAGIVGLIFDAVDGFGTKNEQLKNAVDKINANNVIDVFDSWNKNYKAKEGTLVQRIYDDEFWYDGGNKYVETITAALQKKAEALGIYSELIKEFTTITSELSAKFNTDEKKVAQAVETIYERVKKAEAESTQKAEKADAEKRAEAANKKSEKERKAQEKDNETKAQFVADMREILKDDKAEMSDKVQYKDGNFVIRVEGKNYYGEDYVELAQALKDAGYEPEQYLKKGSVNKKA